MNCVRGLILSLALGLIACVLTLSALGVFAASPTRQALWQAVRACVADFKLTGVPFPCLLVDLTGGEEARIRRPKDAIWAAGHRPGPDTKSHGGRGPVAAIA